MARSDVATDKQLRFINSLAKRKGYDNYVQAHTELMSSAAPNYGSGQMETAYHGDHQDGTITRSDASKLIDMLRSPSTPKKRPESAQVKRDRAKLRAEALDTHTRPFARDNPDLIAQGKTYTDFLNWVDEPVNTLDCEPDEAMVDCFRKYVSGGGAASTRGDMTAEATDKQVRFMTRLAKKAGYDGLEDAVKAITPDGDADALTKAQASDIIGQLKDGTPKSNAKAERVLPFRKAKKPTPRKRNSKKEAPPEEPRPTQYEAIVDGKYVLPPMTRHTMRPVVDGVFVAPPGPHDQAKWQEWFDTLPAEQKPVVLSFNDARDEHHAVLAAKARVEREQHETAMAEFDRKRAQEDAERKARKKTINEAKARLRGDSEDDYLDLDTSTHASVMAVADKYGVEYDGVYGGAFVFKHPDGLVQMNVYPHGFAEIRAASTAQWGKRVDDSEYSTAEIFEAIVAAKDKEDAKKAERLERERQLFLRRGDLSKGKYLTEDGLMAPKGTKSDPDGHYQSAVEQFVIANRGNKWHQKEYPLRGYDYEPIAETLKRINAKPIGVSSGEMIFEVPGGHWISTKPFSAFDEVSFISKNDRQFLVRKTNESAEQRERQAKELERQGVGADIAAVYGATPGGMAIRYFDEEYTPETYWKETRRTKFAAHIGDSRLDLEEGRRRIAGQPPVETPADSPVSVEPESAATLREVDPLPRIAIDERRYGDTPKAEHDDLVAAMYDMEGRIRRESIPYGMGEMYPSLAQSAINKREYGDAIDLLDKMLPHVQDDELAEDMNALRSQLNEAPVSSHIIKAHPDATEEQMRLQAKTFKAGQERAFDEMNIQATPEYTNIDGRQVNRSLFGDDYRQWSEERQEAGKGHTASHWYEYLKGGYRQNLDAPPVPDAKVTRKKSQFGYNVFVDGEYMGEIEKVGSVWKTPTGGQYRTIKQATEQIKAQAARRPAVGHKREFTIDMGGGVVQKMYAEVYERPMGNSTKDPMQRFYAVADEPDPIKARNRINALAELSEQQLVADITARERETASIMRQAAILEPAMQHMTIDTLTGDLADNYEEPIGSAAIQVPEQADAGGHIVEVPEHDAAYRYQKEYDALKAGGASDEIAAHLATSAMPTGETHIEVAPAVTPHVDTDGDGLVDVVDPDKDGDGLPDASGIDLLPMHASESPVVEVDTAFSEPQQVEVVVVESAPITYDEPKPAKAKKAKKRKQGRSRADIIKAAASGATKTKKKTAPKQHPFLSRAESRRR